MSSINESLAAKSGLLLSTNTLTQVANSLMYTAPAAPDLHNLPSNSNPVPNFSNVQNISIASKITSEVSKEIEDIDEDSISESNDGRHQSVAKRDSNSPDLSSPALTKITSVEEFLANNKIWARAMATANPNYFLRLASHHSPQLLWIGCSDSRVPANQIVALEPGDVFVHRNVANIVSHIDLNCLSVIQYAVEVLKVRKIIVCGHYGCGGVLASLSNKQYGLIDNWLRTLKDLFIKNLTQFESLDDLPKKADLLCELNVEQSVRVVTSTSIVQNAWARGQLLSVHGWCYRLTDGIVRDLDIHISGLEQTDQIYRTLLEKSLVANV